jgi:electron transport complex protein RnfG
MNEPATRDAAAPGILKNGLILAAVAAVCTSLVALTFYTTKEKIDANEQAYIEQSLTPVLSGIAFDNSLPASAHTIRPPHELPGNEMAIVYRAMNKGVPAAAAFEVTAPDGFSGPIRMLIGIDANGVVTGARAIRHKETAGLGDQIETSRSDWIHQFAGTSLDAPARSAWTIRRDGGAFDQMTGASVTSRAAVNAINQTLQYFESNREAIFAAQADSESDHD